MCKLPGPVTIVGANQPMDEVIMDDVGSGNKPGPEASRGSGKQGDAGEHQQQRQQREPGKSAHVASQAAMGHAVDGPAANDSQAPKKAESGQGVPHDSSLRAGFPYLTVFNAVLAFTAIVGMFFTGFQLKVAQGQLKQARIANDMVNSALAVANRQADAAEAANAISQAALSASDRAWIYAYFIPKTPLTKTDKFVTQITFKNSGRTPAVNASGNWHLFILPTNTDISDIPTKEEKAKIVIFPDTENSGTLAIKIEDIQKYYDDLINGSRSIFALAKFIYKDISGKDHEYQGCGIYNVDEKSFSRCSNFSDIIK